MSAKNKLIGFLFVFGTLIQSYLGQVSHVPAETVAQWTLHEWVGSLLYVTLAGITAWKAFITNPNEATKTP